MTAKQVTNVVYTYLPSRENVDQAMDVMSSFGEVSSVKVWPELLEVAYYDVRAAERALEELGDSRCWRAQPCGNRIVRLPGSAGLDRTVVNQIRDMWTDETDGDFYILEFFDIRDAEQHRLLCVPETNEQLHDEWHPVSQQGESSVRPKVPEAMPAVTAGQTLTASWWPPRWPEDGTMTSIAEEEVAEVPVFMPGTFIVLLQGVPRELLNPSCVEAILEQAGLAEEVAKFTLHDKLSQGGYCLLTLLTESGVYRCLEHFAGCCWGCRATLMYGDLTMQGCHTGQTGDAMASDEYDYQQADADWPNRLEGSLYPGDAWNFDEAANAASSRPPPKTIAKEVQPTSEASTDLSESDDEMLKLQGRAQHLFAPNATS